MHKPVGTKRRVRVEMRVRVQGMVLAVALSIGALGSPVFAADYPDRPVRVVVPYPPGGGTDVVARIVQGRMQQLLGQTLVIDNRGGGGGSIGSEAVAKSQPDGYTLLFTLSSHTINPAIFPRLSFDTERDFVPVGMAASLPQILVSHPSFEPRTVAELIALAKTKPEQIQFASVGNGSPSHLAGELFNLRAGTRITHIPYRGGGPAVNDVIGGQVPLLWVSIPAAAQFVKAGKLRPIAVSTLRRSSAFPDVPTVDEAGLKGFEVDSWYAMFAPAKTPPAVVAKLNAALNEALGDPAVRSKLLSQGGEAAPGTPESLAAIVSAEIPKWKQLVKDANIKLE